MTHIGLVFGNFLANDPVTQWRGNGIGKAIGKDIAYVELNNLFQNSHAF